MFRGRYLLKSAGAIVSEIDSCSASEALQQFFEHDFLEILRKMAKDYRERLINQLAFLHGEFVKNEHNYACYIKASEDNTAVDRYKRISGEDWSFYYSIDRNYHNIQETMGKIIDIINDYSKLNLSFSYIG